MNSDHENKCTFISPTFKVEENKMPLFFWSDVTWARYELFVIFGLVMGFFVPSWNDKITITH